jgi:TPR repeat protein
MTDQEWNEIMAGVEETAQKFGKITEATEEEVSALSDILAMQKEEARKYNQMGKELEEKELYDNAVKWYIKAAEMGNADAQVNLGCFYHFGHAVHQDYAKALEWFTKAAQQGDAGAQYLTANALYNNRGAPQTMTHEERQTAAL